MAMLWDGPGIGSNFMEPFRPTQPTNISIRGGYTTFFKSDGRGTTQEYLNNHLCKICDSLFDSQCAWTTSNKASIEIGTRLSNDWLPHHRLDDLRDWLFSRCHLCSKIILAVRDRLQLSSVEKDSSQSDKSSHKNSSDLSDSNDRLWVRVIQITNTEKIPEKYILQISLIGDTDASMLDLGSLILWPIKDATKHQLELSDITSSESTTSQIRKWMNLCQSDHSHQNCRQGYRPTSKELPSRLLDLKDVFTSQVVRLIETKNLIQNTEYMTLSHRWGGEHTIELTPETKQDLQYGILMENLPAVFDDAAKLASQLGCRYLWIDALCIMQDKEHIADWLKESAKMSNIYAWSSLNIAASASMRNSESIFRRRNPLAVSPCVIQPQWSYFPSDPLLIEYHTTEDPTGQQPLYQRGWVLQERILAPRAVHFADDQVYWECISSILSEAYPTKHECHVSALLKFRIATLRQKHASSDSFYQVWNDIRQQYGPMGFSQHSDKLIGIAGLAKQFSIDSENSLGKYLAGLWDTHLVPQLAWKVQSPISDRPTTYRAPSWSWASIDGIVVEEQQDLNSDEDLINIIEANTTPIAEEYGLVKAGSLILRGCLCEGKTIRRENPFQITRQPVNGQPEKSLILVIGNWTYLEEELSWDHISEQSYQELHGQRLFILPIRHLQHRPTEREIQLKQDRLTRKILKAMNSQVGDGMKGGPHGQVHENEEFSTDHDTDINNTNTTYTALDDELKYNHKSDTDLNHDSDDYEEYEDDEEGEEEDLKEILALILIAIPSAKGKYRRVGLLHTKDFFGSKVLEEECENQDLSSQNYLSQHLNSDLDLNDHDNSKPMSYLVNKTYVIEII